jgi:2-oxoglutarate decarboxylase
VIIDEFIVSAEDKWGQTSGLVLLLPHGYEGQGPDHSSARLERFLTLAAEDNIQVTQPTTAAQYFHLLRRQVRVRKPLIVLTPKALLRAKVAASPAAAFTSGSFEEVLADTGNVSRDHVRRVLLCSGKIAYDLTKRRDERGAPVAIVRVEQLYPWAEQQIRAQLDRYPAAADVVWVQEEPENQGAWPFAHGRLHRILRESNRRLRHVARFESGSPATGSKVIHEQEHAQILDEAFAEV